MFVCNVVQVGALWNISVGTVFSDSASRAGILSSGSFGSDLLTDTIDINQKVITDNHRFIDRFSDIRSVSIDWLDGKGPYYLEFSIPLGRLNIPRWQFHSWTVFEVLSNKFPTIFYVYFFFFTAQVRLFSFKKGNLKVSDSTCTITGLASFSQCLPLSKSIVDALLTFFTIVF